MTKVNCAEINGTNSAYKLKNGKEICNEHSNSDSSYKREQCTQCISTFKLHCFSGKLRNEGLLLVIICLGGQFSTIF